MDIQSYDMHSWDMECGGEKFLSFWNTFYPFTHLITQKTKILKNLKKTSGDIIILHKSTINNHYMISWDMKHDWQFFLSFWTVFCPFTPLTTWKIKILKNWKKPWKNHHFTQVYQKTWSYAILFLRYGIWQI